MQKFRHTKGFTLTEVLIAMSLFAVVSTIAASVLVDVVQLQKKSSIQNEIYEDARILMQQLTNEIQSGTIDYEEYYSNYVVQKKKLVAGGPYYGINYGVYSSRFFDPGKTLYAPPDAKSPDDLGIECSYPADATKTCEIFFSDSTDLNTGQNPYKNNPGGFTADDANALCDRDLGIGSVPLCAASSHVVPELYLIDSSGTHKTIIAKKNMTNGTCGAGDTDCAIGMMRMTGQDMDQNGITDVFTCDSDYKCADFNDNISAAFQYPFIKNCNALSTCDNINKYLENNNIRLPRKADLAQQFDPNTSQFAPITPRRANIKSLNFTITPLDDPYKAYAESAMQTQPTVTISMTIGLANSAKSDYPGTFPDITLQTTVTAGVIGKIDSYPPVNDVLRTSDKLGWIHDVFN